MLLSQFLKEYRTQTSLSGRELAEKIGVSKHSLERWENNGAMPSYQPAQLLMNFFGITDLNNILNADLKRCIGNALDAPHESNTTDIKNETLDKEQHIVLKNLLAEKDKRIALLEKHVKALEKLAAV